MKAKFILSQDGTSKLGTIEGLPPKGCTKAMEELKHLLPGKVDPKTVKRTAEYHKTQEGKQDLHVG